MREIAHALVALLQVLAIYVVIAALCLMAVGGAAVMLTGIGS